MLISIQIDGVFQLFWMVQSYDYLTGLFQDQSLTLLFRDDESQNQYKCQIQLNKDQIKDKKKIDNQQQYLQHLINNLQCEFLTYRIYLSSIDRLQILQQVFPNGELLIKFFTKSNVDHLRRFFGIDIESIVTNCKNQTEQISYCFIVAPNEFQMNLIKDLVQEILSSEDSENYHKQKKYQNHYEFFDDIQLNSDVLFDSAKIEKYLYRSGDQRLYYSIKSSTSANIFDITISEFIILETYFQIPNLDLYFFVNKKKNKKKIFESLHQKCLEVVISEKNQDRRIKNFDFIIKQLKEFQLCQIFDRTSIDEIITIHYQLTKDQNPKFNNAHSKLLHIEDLTSIINESKCSNQIKQLWNSYSSSKKITEPYKCFLMCLESNYDEIQALVNKKISKIKVKKQFLFSLNVAPQTKEFVEMQEHKKKIKQNFDQMVYCPLMDKRLKLISKTNLFEIEKRNEITIKLWPTNQYIQLDKENEEIQTILNGYFQNKVLYPISTELRLKIDEQMSSKQKFYNNSLIQLKKAGDKQQFKELANFAIERNFDNINKYDLDDFLEFDLYSLNFVEITGLYDLVYHVLKEIKEIQKTDIYKPIEEISIQDDYLKYFKKDLRIFEHFRQKVIESIREAKYRDKFQIQVGISLRQNSNNVIFLELICSKQKQRELLEAFTTIRQEFPSHYEKIQIFRVQITENNDQVDQVCQQIADDMAVHLIKTQNKKKKLVYYIVEKQIPLDNFIKQCEQNLKIQLRVKKIK